MKKTVAVMISALSLVSSVAMAGERGGDAALGALSGAVVLGPIGAVAGAVVGYTAGPSIAHSWGLRGSSTARRARQPARQEAPASVSGNQPAASSPVAAPKTTQAPPPPTNTASTAPPVQSLE